MPERSIDLGSRFLEARIREGVLRVRINRPQKRNATTQDMYRGLKRAAIVADATPNTTYLTAFLAQAQGKPAEYPLRTSDVLFSSRQSLKLQQAADKGLFNLAV